MLAWITTITASLSRRWAAQKVRSSQAMLASLRARHSCSSPTVGFSVVGRLLFEPTTCTVAKVTPRAPPTRSEEHTSELQSRQYLVCRLLLEKKKTQIQ